MANGHGGRRPGAGRKPGERPGYRKEIAERAQAYGDLALGVLVEIATRGSSESARVSASIGILDRGYGKPVQAVTDAAGGPIGLTVQIMRFGREIDAEEQPYARQLADAREPALRSADEDRDGVPVSRNAQRSL